MKPENIARWTPAAPVARTPRAIGAILVDAGKLSVEDAERVMKLQRDENLRFGDAALKLNVLKQSDIDFALSRQFSFDYLQRGSSPVSETVVAVYDPFNPQVEPFRTLRSQVILRWLDGDAARRMIAVVSPEAQEGRSFVAANLAVVLSQLGERVVLVDADLRSPIQHALFGLENRSGLSSVLSGRQTEPETRAIAGLEHLSVLPSGPLPPNPTELLARPGFLQVLETLKSRFDVIVLDSPPALRAADAQLIAQRAAGALLVVRKDQSRALATSEAVEALRGNTTLVGTVLNEY